MKKNETAICDNRDGPGKQYAKRNKSGGMWWNTMWSHLYVESERKEGRKTEFMDIESRLVIASEEDEVQSGLQGHEEERHTFSLIK